MAWAVGTVWIASHCLGRWQQSSVDGAAAWLLAASLLIVAPAMSVGLFYLLGIVGKSLWYLLAPSPRPVEFDASPGQATRPLVVLYLTAGDFDAAAVDSLLRLNSNGPRLFLLHDDGQDDLARAQMRRLLLEHPQAAGWEIAVWHRPRREGGKAGAVNWVLQRLAPQWRIMLLCDSDSIALDPDAVLRAEPEFDDDAVAAVQFRNVSHSDPDEPPFQRRLARAIDVFDALATPRAAWGYVPFMGHNALLRLTDVRALGGLTPGFFSDDLDLSARMTLAGKRIVYRRDIAFAERHPADLDSFRKRCRKWALGCTQVVRVRARAVTRQSGIPLAHRIGLLEFMFFYPSMLLLVAGLLVAHLALPLLAPQQGLSDAVCAVIGGGVVLALLTPTLAWSVQHRRLRSWPAFAWSCILVYGGSLLPTVRGVLDGLSSRERPWIPTNLASRRAAVPPVALAECALGASLIAVPWIAAAQDLAFPSTYLFVSVFLFSPLTFLAYRSPAAPQPRPAAVHSPRPARRRVLRRAAAPTAAALTVLGLAMAARAEPVTSVRGDRILLDGREFHIRGIHYSPWLPGTGPDGRSDYAGPETVRPDLDRIVQLGANTVLIHSAPGWVVDEARQRGLAVVYKFFIPWHDTSPEAFDAAADSIVEQIRLLREHDGIILWVLGNEVTRWVVDELGAEEVGARLAGLAQRVREVDSTRLIGHANWPVTREIPTDAFDIVCFNLYPAWPYEVSVRGFGPFLREVIKPIAAGRPLLITEFGINSLEAGEARQAQVVADCWREIVASDIAGGILFSWADEWWKNFDNPIPDKGYWERQYDPDDALRHEDDPEEHYGIVRTDRTPKRAYAAVAEMWSGDPAEAGRGRSMVPWLILAALGVATLVVLGLPRRERLADPVPGSTQGEKS